MNPFQTFFSSVKNWPYPLGFIYSSDIISISWEFELSLGLIEPSDPNLNAWERDLSLELICSIIQLHEVWTEFMIDLPLWHNFNRMRFRLVFKIAHPLPHNLKYKSLRWVIKVMNSLRKR